MESILKPVSVVALLAAGSALLVGRSAVWRTSLRTAWWWSAGGLAAWSVVWLLAVPAGRWTGTGAAVAWYGVAVAMLCPPVAVLGARWPGAQAWTWFVLLPLLAVLNLPAVTGLLLGAGDVQETTSTFQLEAPWAIGLALVLIMGVGNYIGTRMTLPAVAYAVAVVLLVGPQIAGVADWLPTWVSAPEWATVALGLSAGSALLVGCVRRPAAEHPVDQLWQDFRNLYGIVWARRVMDRTNEALAARRLPARLEWYGIGPTVPESEAADPALVAAACDHAAHTLRWLLKRFVDPEWIEQRLSPENERVTG